MRRKFLSTKAAKKFIIEGRNNDKTDQEIYYELKQQYYDKKSIALFITGIATKENRDKYKIFKYILLGLILIEFFFNLVMVIRLSSETESFLVHAYWLAQLSLFIGIYIYAFAKDYAWAYQTNAILTIFLFISPITYRIGETSIIINIVLISLIVGLLFYTLRKMFPYYRPYNMKRDANGEYIVG
jgi:hypothetical protein